jgi:uncharacterized phiE125 gp8 family phage protein
MGHRLITGPAVEPITLAEAKLHLRIEDAVTADDDLITSLIVAARQAAEHECRRALITQTWELSIDAFPACEIELPQARLIDITSVTYIDAAGDSQVLDAAAYTTDTDQEPGWLLREVDTDWPDTLDTANAVRVRYRAGYGATAASVPDAIKAWMRLRIGALYRHREELSGVASYKLAERFSDSLLDPFRIVLT